MLYWCQNLTGNKLWWFIIVIFLLNDRLFNTLFTSLPFHPIPTPNINLLWFQLLLNSIVSGSDPKAIAGFEGPQEVGIIEIELRTINLKRPIIAQVWDHGTQNSRYWTTFRCREAFFLPNEQAGLSVLQHTGKCHGEIRNCGNLRSRNILNIQTSFHQPTLPLTCPSLPTIRPFSNCSAFILPSLANCPTRSCALPFNSLNQSSLNRVKMIL